MAFWLNDSSGLSNPQTSVGHKSVLKKGSDQLKSFVLYGSRIIVDVANSLIPSRTHSAPSTVGREDEDGEEEKSYEIQSLSSCGDLISKLQPRENQEVSLKTRKGNRKVSLFQKIRTRRTGNYSLEEKENFENRKQSWVGVSIQNDCSGELVETTKGIRSADENEGFEKRRRSWFKSKKKVSISDCPGRSVESKTGVPELTVFMVNTNDNAETFTKSKTEPVEEINKIFLI